MRIYILTISLLIIISVPTGHLDAEERDVIFHEDFNSLDDWKPLYFKEISKYTSYSIEKTGGESFLLTDSRMSASGIIFKNEFNVFEYPKVRWRWKISNVYKKGNAKEKSGDDYPIRVYILFKYNPEAATIGQKFKYGLVKALYGEYPPHSTISYIWANRYHKEEILTNRYVDEAKMVILQYGMKKLGRWIDQEVNIIEDYRKAFGEDPPEIASLAIMNDSDNTGESSVSNIDYIEVFR